MNRFDFLKQIALFSAGSALLPWLSKSGYLPDLFPVAKAPYFFPSGYDIAGYCRAKSRNMGEQGGTCGVEIDTHIVHATFDHIGQLFGQSGLIEIVLIESHTDRFWIDLHQFSQWILHTPRDGDVASLSCSRFGMQDRCPSPPDL